MPISVSSLSKAWFSDRTLTGVKGLNPTGDTYLSVVNVVCCQVQVSATGRLPVERSPTEWDVSEYDPEISTLSSPWSARAAESHPKKKTQNNN
jgi:hypothetical protein